MLLRVVEVGISFVTAKGRIMEMAWFTMMASTSAVSIVISRIVLSIIIIASSAPLRIIVPISPISVSTVTSSPVIFISITLTVPLVSGVLSTRILRLRLIIAMLIRGISIVVPALMSIIVPATTLSITLRIITAVN